jgi:hypothetical protein
MFLGSPEPIKLLFIYHTKISRWIENLPETFKKLNLEKIENSVTFEKPWQSRMASDMSVGVVHEMSENGSPFVTAKLQQYGVSVPLAFAEVSKGSRLVQPFCVTLGRKPE